jgi:DNA topoisomerase-1
MSRTLMIVESPAKAKTIGRYLGEGYQVKASVGHVRDLPVKTLGVDVEGGFVPVYEISPGKRAVLDEIRTAARAADRIYLATDPDREGEAIAWHVAEAAGLDPKITQRIVFHQVTREAVQHALTEARDLDRDLIDAQQARRVLDRLVGYQISPLLSKTMHKPLSAGRVQSVALRLVVDREREIRAFVPVEYWSLDADLQRRTPAREVFRAHLVKIRGQDPELKARTDVDRILTALEGAQYRVCEVEVGERRRRPQPPFITSTLQAAASNRLHLSPQQTMRLAQQLYEGIEVDGAPVGLITYMRTDSTQVAPEAQQEARGYIAERYGAEYLPPQAPQYRTKSALAQEAHEAIRPTSVLRTPEAMRAVLDARQARLYELIWQRFVASQMVSAVYETMRVDVVAARDYLFRATGQRLLFPGYLAVYRDEDDDKEEIRTLPPLVIGEAVALLQLLPEQHFTQPPPRFSEATLVKELESNGVGRPSTYASIVSVIQNRQYVTKTKNQLVPTDLGMVVCDGLMAAFTDIVDVGYTAAMEAHLDDVAAGKLGYRRMLEDFYGPFTRELAGAQTLIATAVERSLSANLAVAPEAMVCPQCGRPLQVKLSRAGRFLGCTGYPECRYTQDLDQAGQVRETAEVYAEGEICDKCGGRMRIISRGASRFLGCEHYPQCKNTRAILSDRIKELAQATACPTCGAQPLVPKSGRFGEYLHCPTCNVNYSLSKLGLAAGRKKGARGAPATPAETVDLACPNCGRRPVEKREGDYGTYYRCPACKKNTSERKMGADVAVTVTFPAEGAGTADSAVEGVAKASIQPAELACLECGSAQLERREGRYGPYHHCLACRKNTPERKLVAGAENTPDLKPASPAGVRTTKPKRRARASK